MRNIGSPPPVPRVGDIDANTIINQQDNEPLKLWVGSQDEYDALPTKDADTLYMVQE